MPFFTTAIPAMRPLGRLVAIAVTTLLSLPCLAAAPTAGSKVVFEVLPQRGAPVPEASLALEGFAYLRRTDDPTATRTVPLNRAVELPAGEWQWHAEAPGFITVGWNVVSTGPGAPPTQKAVAPAAPACSVEPRREPRLGTFRRFEVVALEEASLYRFDLPERAAFPVPSGRFFLVGYGPQGLIGISGPHLCSPPENLVLALPSPPKAEHHALLVKLRLPATDKALKLNELLAVARPASPRERLNAILPTAVVWAGTVGVALFPRLPARSELELAVQHPQLRTHERVFPALGGGATALEEKPLRRRPTLTVPIDYKPARPHKRQEVQAYHCGRRDRGEDLYIEADSCVAIGPPQKLRPGLAEYRFPDLDTGQYLLNATVDDEVVYGLGHWLEPYLGEDQAAFEEVEPLALAELHLWGHLLSGGEPVPGELRLVPITYPTNTRRFPTDDELLYHWYYFGYLPPFDVATRELPETAHGRRPEELMGIYKGFVLNACTETGACRSYRWGFSLAGGGRLDFDLGEDNEVVVTVTDRETGEPLENAMVVSEEFAYGDTFHYFGGKTVTRPHDRPADSTVYTDAEGRAALRLKPGKTSVGAGFLPGSGYKEMLREITVLEGERLDLDFPLEREEEGPQLPRFVFGNGNPVAKAYLPAFDREGRRKPGCHAITLADGRARFPEGCLAGSTVALLHPQAALSLFDGSSLDAGSKTTVDPAPRVPLSVRLIDSSGQPLPGATVELHYGPLALDPRDFAVAQAMSGQPFITPADAEGEILLRGVESTGAAVPEVGASGAPESERLSLAGVRGGEPLELLVP